MSQKQRLIIREIDLESRLNVSRVSVFLIFNLALTCVATLWFFGDRSGTFISGIMAFIYLINMSFFKLRLYLDLLA